jgi:hypothetical protein
MREDATNTAALHQPKEMVQAQNTDRVLLQGP